VNRDEFNKLPPAMQLRVLARVVFEREALADINVGRKPLPPQYDLRMYRSGGFQWASETSLEGLCFWCNKAREGAARGGEHASKDAKRVKDLERWINWREWFPGDLWSGMRNDESTVGKPPVDKPDIHAHEPRNGQRGGGQQRQQQPPPNEDDGDVGFA
jgi:hypothetical protein